MGANNETGVVYPVDEMARITKETDPGIVFHSDATQTVGKLPVDLSESFRHVDLLSFSGHKLHAPKGIGALFMRRGTRSRLVKPAREAELHALAYATRDRKQRKRQMRALWILRITAAARLSGLTYGQLVSGLKRAGISLDRKILADIAARDPETFGKIAQAAQEA